MEKIIIATIIFIVGAVYSVWGFSVLFNASYAKRIGDRLRKTFNVRSTGELDEAIFDRLGRGGPAIVLGLMVAFYGLRQLIILLT